MNTQARITGKTIGGQATYNPKNARWEYPPICLDGIDRDLARRAELRARENALYEHVNGKPRTYPDSGTVRCGECRGEGLVNAEAGYSDDNRFCDCPACNGTGWRK